jgi:hypothetical protein
MMNKAINCDNLRHQIKAALLLTAVGGDPTAASTDEAMVSGIFYT